LNDPPASDSQLGKRPKIAACVAIAALSLGVLYGWYRVVTIGMAFGPRPGFWIVLGATIGGLVGAIALSAWLARRSIRTGLGSPWLWVIAGAWTAAGVAFWYLSASPLARGGVLAAGFAATTWWLLWAWMMPLVPWRRAGRIGLLAALVVVAAACLGSVRVDGMDGNARPLLAWRFTPPLRDWTVTSGAAGDADDLDDTSAMPARDYPRFRGADGSGIVVGVNLARDWSRQKPKLRWRREVGEAWSAIAVAGKRVFTQEQRGDEECVTCYARASGSPLWVHRDRARYTMPVTGDGPRATPTVDGQHVFALGATGILNCLDCTSGQRRWTVDILKDTGAILRFHGMVSSPLVIGEMVVVCAGGTNNTSLVAYDKSTGKRVWAAGDDPAGYTSPQLIELAGVPQIVVLTPRRIVGHDVGSGTELWSAAFENTTQTNCSQPCRVSDNRLFASTDYGTGCTLLEIGRDGDAWQAQAVWANRTMQTKFCSAVVRDGHAYGLDDGILECVSLDDGRRRWKQGRYGHGQLLMVDDLLLIVAEDGRVALVELKPDKYSERASFQAIEGRTWNYPALAGGELFVRNDREAACYELPLNAD
jgi:outer membrane protein assembly factor BamB